MAPSHSDDDYSRSIELMRGEKDHWLRTDPHSPMPAVLRESFGALSYFSPDPAFRFQVRLHRSPEPEMVVLATSKGAPRNMLRYGYFEFELEGQIQSLHVYKAAPAAGHHHEDRNLFVPFRDATSGKDSYGAARYLDIEEQAGDEHILDFNLAYNPYCAYSDEYVCPFPPRENWLTVAIRAGEKNFRRP